MARMATLGGAVVAAAALTAFTAPAAFADGGSAVTTSAEKSIVQVQVDFAGLIGKPTMLGGFRWTSTPTFVTQSCTGFFVTGSGHIATAGHCVDPAEAREALITQYLEDRGQLDELPEALATWDVQGPTPGSDVQRQIQVDQPADVVGAGLSRAQTARLLDFEPAEDGDLALLKVERTGTPALPIGAVDPAAGDAVTAVGFPGLVEAVSDPDLVRASFTSGTVSSNQVSRGGVAQTEINADLAPGMSGGPTLDATGVVVGVNSFILKGQQSFNFITDTTDLRDWLATQGLTTPSQAPAGADPAGLLVDGGPIQNAAFETPDGSVMSPWLLGGVLGAVALLATAAGLFRKRRAATPAAFGPAPMHSPMPAGPMPHGPVQNGPMPHGPVQNGPRPQGYAPVPTRTPMTPPAGVPAQHAAAQRPTVQRPTAPGATVVLHRPRP